MQLRDNGLGFSPLTVVVHWLVASLLFSIIALSIIASSVADSTPAANLLGVRNLLGVLLFLVSIYRFWARITSFHPLPLGTPNPVEVIISRSVAVALALAMVLLPMAVWLTWSTAGTAMPLPWGLSIPTVIGPNPQAHRVFEFLLRLGSTAFFAGLALHIFGALKNHFGFRNDVLKRMLGKHVEL
ncbi:cytochrome b/b6 domain-containing protein [Burkholderia cenocepacia]|jgi:cytochrome b561|uniref:cytochrome b n=1 Tax=Burkholderia cenocepacia TaxID=95486 RepID=UPI0004F8D7B1|nr:cytochrome b/b6 domain-containing protein [Burkholderia cenocepacia]AIO43200.1 prokaryotic cytochrome b561 family protein [Burkholderia cepacia]KGC05373.1 prokaryotic cytochrome b561 family protein [Burkholderia cepacia]MCG0577987.1 cytochrome b/b6 domain-containing protein [Burkholderia cenocepacia]MCW3524445.1 cytochrome b/b6 domain-containing protein [Burkholderia cenocepacia]MCW3614667.1 cytochrome b/b6 domain-containing protein [Burkholderia cenocepacia]